MIQYFDANEKRIRRPYQFSFNISRVETLAANVRNNKYTADTISNIRSWISNDIKRMKCLILENMS